MRYSAELCQPLFIDNQNRTSSGSRGLVVALALVMLVAWQPGATAEDLGEASLPGQSLVTQLIDDAKSAGATFPAVDLLELRDGADRQKAIDGILQKGSILGIRAETNQWLLKHAPQSLTVPIAGSTGLELELVRVDIFAEGFRVVAASSDGQAVAYKGGLHYRGVVKGVPDSLAALSIFDDEVIGIYGIPGSGTSVIGKLTGDNPSNDHILYAEAELISKPAFSCLTEGRPFDIAKPVSEETAVHSLPKPIQHPELAKASKCVRIYIEADDNLYQEYHSVTGVANYVSGIFNQAATFFTNEGVPIVISELYVWDRTSPYSKNNIYWSLNSFKSYRNEFAGDLAHLITLTGFGGLAEIDGLCNSNPDRRMAVSGVETSWSYVPTYSFTVYVFAHELGHQIGSQHTHACVWNGDNTAIDGCGGATEGSCPVPPVPADGGTIMSYCHHEPEGINFNKGFGPQPGALIQSKFNSASCLGGWIVNRNDIRMIVTYMPRAEYSRVTRVATSRDPLSLEYRYDESLGSFLERPGGACHVAGENPTYLKISFDTPYVSYCYFKGPGDPGWIPCSSAHRNVVNAGTEIILNTDEYLYDPATCDILIPPESHLPYYQSAKFEVALRIGGNWHYRTLIYKKYR